MEPNDNIFKIIKLQDENFKKLKAIEITPQGDTIMISGKIGICIEDGMITHDNYKNLR